MFSEVVIHKGSLLYLYFLYVFLDFVTFVYVFFKMYRAICYTKLVFDQIPFINPYRWPARAIFVLGKPYFRFFSLIIPTTFGRRYGVDFATFIGLEVLTILVHLSASASTPIILKIYALEIALKHI